MKLTFEVHGYTIVIEETEENLIKVYAEQDGEEIESFELEGGEDHPVHSDDEEEMELPEGGEEGEEIEGEAPESDFEENPAGEEETKLESFASFLRKKK